MSSEMDGPLRGLKIRWLDWSCYLVDESQLVLNEFKKEKNMATLEGLYGIGLPQASMAPKGLGNLSLDDVVLDDDGCELTVAGRYGRVIFLEDEDGHIEGTYTVKELRDDDFTVKPVKEDVLELTVAEISKKYGKTVKVVER
jgi:hypothetical protein